MNLSLLVISQGRAAGDAIPITLPQFIIGRDKQCHLRPISPLVSKRHCALLVERDRVLVRDLNSTNGTFLNNEQIEGERELQDGDHLKIGPLAFQIVIERQAGVNEPTPPPGKNMEELGDDDDAIAALLLDGGDAQSALDDASGAENVAEDTTMMEMQMLPDETGEGEIEAEKQAEAEESQGDDDASTSSAAAEILSQYARRQRP